MSVCLSNANDRRPHKSYEVRPREARDDIYRSWCNIRRIVVSSEELDNGIEMKDETEELFLRQKVLLDTFLEHHAIDKKQYIKSLTDLIQKMGVKDYTEIEY